MNYATLHDDAFAYEEYLRERADELYEEYVAEIEYDLWIAQAQAQQDQNDEFWTEEEPTYFLEEGWNDSAAVAQAKQPEAETQAQAKPVYEHLDVRMSRSSICRLALQGRLEHASWFPETNFFFYAHEVDNILLWHKPMAMLFALQHNVYVRQLIVVEENGDWVEKEVFTSFYDYVNR